LSHPFISPKKIGRYFCREKRKFRKRERAGSGGREKEELKEGPER